MSDRVVVRQLGLQEFELVSLAMHRFTDMRNSASADEIWLVQHPPVFTEGKKGKQEKSDNILMSGNIPIILSDRGGKITFHGPGQQIMYVLLDLRRRQLGIRSLVTLLEQIVISTLSNFSIDSHSCIDKPGVYVGNEKICSLGLCIRNGCSFHGLALNVKMDLTPFLFINPCGYAGLKMTQVSNFSPDTDIDDVVPVLLTECLQKLNVSSGNIQSWITAQYGM